MNKKKHQQAQAATLPTKGQMGQALVILGYRDYVAARFLLLHDFVIQGTTLASTAVEKYLKAVLLTQGQRAFGHLDSLEIVKRIRKTGLDLLVNVNQDFLEFLGIVYKLRYYDEIQSPITLSMYKWKIIAELDHTVSFIESRLIIKHGDGQPWLTPYQHARQAKDPHLWQENYVLQATDKTQFVERAALTIVLRIDLNAREIELSRPDFTPKNDGKFLGETLEVVDDGKGILVSYLHPVKESLNGFE